MANKETIKHKVKMKLRTKPAAKSQPSSSSLVILSIPLPLLLLIFAHLCDTTTQSRTSSYNGSALVANDGPEVVQVSPEFASKQEKLVIASKWDNEVFLPCKINNLDEEQTVSSSWKWSNLVLL